MGKWENGRGGVSRRGRGKEERGEGEWVEGG